jgi:hypothetical protein
VPGREILVWGLPRALFLFRWLSRASPGCASCLTFVLAMGTAAFLIYFVIVTLSSL